MATAITPNGDNVIPLNGDPSSIAFWASLARFDAALLRLFPWLTADQLRRGSIEDREAAPPSPADLASLGVIDLSAHRRAIQKGPK